MTTRCGDINSQRQIKMFSFASIRLEIMYGGVILTLLLFQVAESSQRWYYTGKFWPSEEKVGEVKLFSGHVFRPLDLFDPSTAQKQDHILYAGGYVLGHIGNDTEIEGEVTKLREDVDLRGFVGHVIGVEDLVFDVSIYHKYKIHIVNDYSAPNKTEITEMDTVEKLEYEIFEAEVGLYDHNRGVFLEKHRHAILAGHLHAVQVDTATTRHNVIYTADAYNRRSVIFHTHSSIAADDNLNKHLDNIRIMTYNLWHNNPPSWVFHDPR